MRTKKNKLIKKRILKHNLLIADMAEKGFYAMQSCVTTIIGMLAFWKAYENISFP